MSGDPGKSGRSSTSAAPTPWLAGPFGPAWRNRSLVRILVWSEVKANYRRATLGLFWLILFPLFYVVVFVAVRLLLFDRSASSPDWEGARLGINDVSMIGLMIFVGFVVFWSATEMLTRGASAVTRHSSYVSDSVFPVEVLPWVVIGAAVFNLAVRTVLFLVAYLIIVQVAHPTMLLLPIVVAPLMLIMIGLTYFLAAIGPYFRDLEYIISALSTALLLLSAVIFPLSEVPQSYQPFVIYNPIAMTIEQARLIMVLGRLPDWNYLAAAGLIGLGLAWAGFAFFRLRKRNFADVL